MDKGNYFKITDIFCYNLIYENYQFSARGADLILCLLLLTKKNALKIMLVQQLLRVQWGL